MIEWENLWGAQPWDPCQASVIVNYFFQKCCAKGFPCSVKLKNAWKLKLLIAMSSTDMLFRQYKYGILSCPMVTSSFLVSQSWMVVIGRVVEIDTYMEAIVSFKNKSGLQRLSEISCIPTTMFLTFLYHPRIQNSPPAVCYILIMIWLTQIFVNRIQHSKKSVQTTILVV